MCDFIIDLFNIDKDIIKNIENFFSDIKSGHIDPTFYLHLTWHKDYYKLIILFFIRFFLLHSN